MSNEEKAAHHPTPKLCTDIKRLKCTSKYSIPICNPYVPSELERRHEKRFPLPKAMGTGSHSQRNPQHPTQHDTQDSSSRIGGAAENVYVQSSCVKNKWHGAPGTFQQQRQETQCFDTTQAEIDWAPSGFIHQRRGHACGTLPQTRAYFPRLQNILTRGQKTITRWYHTICG